MPTVLVAEDDTHTRQWLDAVLRKHGFQVVQAGDGLAALQVLDTEQVDLVVVDVMMPLLDGYEFTRQVRQAWPGLPVLMVTARQTPRDKRQGFLVGTDDYLTKPVDEQEMILRIRALLRRARIATEHRLVIGATTVDADALSVSRGGEVLTLPLKEFRLLFTLLSNLNVIFTRLQLMNLVWGQDTDTDDHSLNVHISRLRDRFRDWGDFDIVTVRGLGYKGVRRP
jgi:DNA-binding response OmpR family regulator